MEVLKMPIYNKNQLNNESKELHVIRDTYEKVCRLKDILCYFASNDLLNSSLALKGGTAINLLIYDLPRLSTDLDLDLCKNESKEEMAKDRERITEQVNSYMNQQGYVLSENSKMTHSLVSLEYSYVNSAGNKDRLKIEINYSLRVHVLPVERRSFIATQFISDTKISMLSPIEIFAAKTVASLNRSAIRDLYDMNYLVQHPLFSKSEMEMYRKCVIFYLAIGTAIPMLDIDYGFIESYKQHSVHTDLNPVMRDKDAFELNAAQRAVIDFINTNIFFTSEERQFLVEFKNGLYQPELLFDEPEILKRIENHPMALWKTMKLKGMSI